MSVSRGHWLIKHCTPPPSTGHLNSNRNIVTTYCGLHSMLHNSHTYCIWFCMRVCVCVCARKYVCLSLGQCVYVSVRVCMCVWVRERESMQREHTCVHKLECMRKYVHHVCTSAFCKPFLICSRATPSHRNSLHYDFILRSLNLGLIITWSCKVDTKAKLIRNLASPLNGSVFWRWTHIFPAASLEQVKLQSQMRAA